MWPTFSLCLFLLLSLLLAQPSDASSSSSGGSNSAGSISSSSAGSSSGGSLPEPEEAAFQGAYINTYMLPLLPLPLYPPQTMTDALIAHIWHVKIEF